MAKARIWTSTDPFIAARMRQTAMVKGGEVKLTAGVTAAMARWLHQAENAIFGHTARLPHRTPGAVTAAAGDASSSSGFPAGSMPNLNLWPDAASWQVMLDTVALPEVTKLFGKAFADATKNADIQEAHYSQAYLATASNRLSQNMWPEYVFGQVQDVVSEGIAEGWSITRITEELSKTLDVDHYTWQARRIARTETMGAVNSGAYNGASAMAEMTGQTMFKQWYATMDSRTRDDHARAHLQVVPLDVDFIVGGFSMDYPGGDGPAEEVCNCRCTLLVLDESEAAEYIDPEQWDDSGGDESASDVQDALQEADLGQANTTILPEDLVPSVTGSAVARFAPTGPGPVIAPGSTPPVVMPTGDARDLMASGGDMGNWYGVLAPMDHPSADGRMIAAPDDGEPRTRPLPIPLLYQDNLASGHDGAFQVGLINKAWIQDGNLMGSGTFDLDDPRAAAIARKVATGNAGWISVDLDDTTMEIAPHADGSDSDMAVASNWRLMSATLVNQPAFPEAKIFSGVCPEDPADMATNTGVGDITAAGSFQTFTSTDDVCDDPDCAYCETCPDEDEAAAGDGDEDGQDDEDPDPDACDDPDCVICALYDEYQDDDDGGGWCGCPDCLRQAAARAELDDIEVPCSLAASGSKYDEDDDQFGETDAVRFEKAGTAHPHKGNPAKHAATLAKEAAAKKAAAARKAARHSAAVAKEASRKSASAAKKAAHTTDETAKKTAAAAAAAAKKTADAAKAEARKAASVAAAEAKKEASAAKKAAAVSAKAAATAAKPVKATAAKPGVPAKGTALPVARPLPGAPTAVSKSPGRTTVSRPLGTPAPLPTPSPALLSMTSIGSRPMHAFTVLHPDTGLPVADVGKAWDGAGAAQRVADYAKGPDGKINPAKYGKAFLYRDDSADPKTVGAYKLGYADIVNGRLTIIPRGVYAVAGALSGARTPTTIPAAQQDDIKAAVERLYGRIASSTGDDSIVAPWKDDKSSSSSGTTAKAAAVTVAHFARRRPAAARAESPSSGQFAPPRDWFGDPGLDAPTGITIDDDGRVYGHLATWGTCHTGIPNKCVTAPKSRSGYAYFHLGTVRTEEGDDVAVGTLHYSTDHADTRQNLPAAQRHYADTGCAGAVVRAGEDKHGIWVAGAVLPGADLVTLRHAPLSGDWRSVGGSMELVGALCVNQPGFPVPRPRWSTDDRQKVYALCAAGSLAPTAGDVLDDADGGVDSAGTETSPVMTEFIAGLADGLARRLRADDEGASRRTRLAAALKHLGGKPPTGAATTRPAPVGVGVPTARARVGVLLASMQKGA